MVVVHPSTCTHEAVEKQSEQGQLGGMHFYEAQIRRQGKRVVVGEEVEEWH